MGKQTTTTTRIAIAHPSFADQYEIDRRKGGPDNQIKTIADAEKAIEIACAGNDNMSESNQKYWAAQKEHYQIVEITTTRTILQ